MDGAKNRSDHRKRTPMIIQRLRALRSRSIRKPVTQPKGCAVVSADWALQDPYPHIFVKDDGTARELHAAERAYLKQAFIPFDAFIREKATSNPDSTAVEPSWIVTSLS
jgi:hypothetical protein